MLSVGKRKFVSGYDAIAYIERLAEVSQQLTDETGYD
jgi:hypothetical protein